MKRKALFAVVSLLVLVAVAATGCGKVAGIGGSVKDATTQAAISGASITITPGNKTTASNSMGAYMVTGFKAGVYTMTITAANYQSKTEQVVVTTADLGATITKNITLSAGTNNTNVTPGSYTITITVTNASAAPVASANVAIAGLGTQVTDASGVATFTSVANGTYAVGVTATGYNDGTTSVTVNGANATGSVMLTASTPINEWVEKMTNGDFANGTTGWEALSMVAGNGNGNASGGVLTLTSTGGAYVWHQVVDCTGNYSQFDFTCQLTSNAQGSGAGIGILLDTYAGPGASGSKLYIGDDTPDGDSSGTRSISRGSHNFSSYPFFDCWLIVDAGTGATGAYSLCSLKVK